MTRRAWTQAEDRLVRQRYPHVPSADLLALLPGRNLSMIYGRAATLRLAKTAVFLNSPAAHRMDGVKGLGTRFQTGHVSWNKGTHFTAGGRSALTRFKPGSRSVRWPAGDYPVGALRINSDGGLDIKIREGPRAWTCMARWVWMSERGPIPKNGVVRAINGDPYDTRIENLRLTTRAELMAENTVHRYPQALARLIQLRGALQRQINQREQAHEQRYR